MRRGFATAAIVMMVLAPGAVALAQAGANDGRDTVARALGGAWLPLESGLVISAREGTPLSAKYEMDNGQR